MNYNTDSFIIDAGHFIQTIMFKAPYINGAPLDYSKTKRIFNALHESVFNSIFPWANINNHPLTAIEEAYEGYQLRSIVDGYVYQYLGKDNQGKPQYSSPIPYAPKEHNVWGQFESEEELPVNSTPGALYLVGGEFAAEQWVTYLVHSVLEPIGIELKKAILRHAGTRRKFEWHFEYVSNGIFYTLASAKPAVIEQPARQLSEFDQINRAILAQQAVPTLKLNNMSDYRLVEQALQALHQPAVKQRPETSFTVDIRPYANEEQFNKVLIDAAGLLGTPKVQGSKLTITVTYTVQGYFDKLVTFINQFIETNRLDIVVVVKSDWARPIVEATPVVDHYMQGVMQKTASVNAQLKTLRQDIVKANRITELQGRELAQLAPELFRMVITPNDMAELMNVDDPTMRFYGKDPMLLDQPVLMMCLAIDRYTDGPALPQQVAVPQVEQAVPLAAVNMNGLLIQELQGRLAALDPNDKDYEKRYRDIIASLAKLGCNQ